MGEKGAKGKDLLIKEELAAGSSNGMLGRQTLDLAVKPFLVTFDVTVWIECRIQNQINGDYSEDLELD